MGIQEDIRSVVGEKRLALTPFLQASKASVKDKSGRRRWSRDRWRERLAGLKYGGMMLFEPLTLRKNTRKKEIVFLSFFFFLSGLCLKSLLNLLQYCFCFIF